MLCLPSVDLFSVFFFNDTATTEIYTLSLHDALPISGDPDPRRRRAPLRRDRGRPHLHGRARPVLRHQPAVLVFLDRAAVRSEEHTSELQSPCNFVCRLLLEKKKKFSWNAQRIQ